MITKVQGEAPFQVLTNNFSIGPSNEGYTLQISADGENYSNLFTVNANTTRLVTGVAASSYYRLSGNNSLVTVNWMKTCVTEGGGSGSGSTVSVNQILSAGTQIASITVDNNTTMLYAPEGGDMEQLIPVAEYPENPERGTVVSKLEELYGWWEIDDGGEPPLPGFILAFDVSGDTGFPEYPETDRIVEYKIADFPDGHFITIRKNSEDNYTSLKLYASEAAFEEDDAEQEKMYYGDEQDEALSFNIDDIYYDIEPGFWGEDDDYAIAINTYDDSTGNDIPFDGNLYDAGGDMGLKIFDGVEWIDAGGKGGGETVIELTQAEYDALVDKDPNTTYIISDAQSINMDDYAKQADLTTLSGNVENMGTALEGKADKASVTANTNARKFPVWNGEGIITGSTGNTVYERAVSINGVSQSVLRTANSDLTSFYAPTAAGTAGQPLLSNGSGAPVWAPKAFAFVTQTQYDNLGTPDANTIYFICGD